MTDDFLCYGETGYCYLLDEQDGKTCLDLGEYPGDVPSIAGWGTGMAAARDPSKWCQGCIEVGVARLQAELEAASTGRAERDSLREALARMIERAEFPDQCGLCGELLDKPENDLGDGESLGHTLECDVESARALLAGTP